jgi:hypothetical protein
MASSEGTREAGAAATGGASAGLEPPQAVHRREGGIERAAAVLGHRHRPLDEPEELVADDDRLLARRRVDLGELRVGVIEADHHLHAVELGEDLGERRRGLLAGDARGAEGEGGPHRGLGPADGAARHIGRLQALGERDGLTGLAHLGLRGRCRRQGSQREEEERGAKTEDAHGGELRTKPVRAGADF